MLPIICRHEVPIDGSLVDQRCQRKLNWVRMDKLSERWPYEPAFFYQAQRRAQEAARDEYAFTRITSQQCRWLTGSQEWCELRFRTATEAGQWPKANS
jgi:hypothetical protein